MQSGLNLTQDSSFGGNPSLSSMTFSSSASGNALGESGAATDSTQNVNGRISESQRLALVRRTINQPSFQNMVNSVGVQPTRFNGNVQPREGGSPSMPPPSNPSPAMANGWLEQRMMELQREVDQRNLEKGGSMEH